MKLHLLFLSIVVITGQHMHPQGGMDFDQDRTVHHFRLASDGGSVQVDVRRAADVELRDTVRMHLSHLSEEFAAGSFDKPFVTHGETPDGVPEMVRLKERITYTFESTANGGLVRIRTADESARSAIHAFLRYQIREHKTGDPLTVGK
jgi:hypothetical protein